jgi:hypothetical protein
MAATTGQLGLVTPTQGTLSGTWGDTVNNGITEYTNLAIAATLTLTGDGAVTLANTTGDASASNITSTLAGAGTVTAQHAVVRVSGTLTTTKVVTGPSYSKTYIVINDATGGSVTIKAAGQSGVTIAVSDKALVAFNGTDYVRVGASAGGSNTQVQYNSGGNLAGSANLTFDGTTLTANDLIDSSLTASKPVFTNGSKNLVSTGTLGTDQGGTNLTSFTSGGALYATSTSALTTGTLPVASGGTSQTTYATGDMLYASATNTVSKLGIGSTNQILTVVAGVPAWAAAPAAGVTSFSAGTTGFTPSTGTTGAVTLAGTLGVANGGTNLTATPTNGQLPIGNGTNYTLATITAGTGISVTNGSGSITIATAGGGSGGTGSNLYLAVNFGGF